MEQIKVNHDADLHLMSHVQLQRGETSRMHLDAIKVHHSGAKMSSCSCRVLKSSAVLKVFVRAANKS